MMLSDNGKILATLLVFFVIVGILLTPIGFETRSPSKITSIGLIVAPILVLSLVLNAGSILVLSRKVRLASTLAIIGSIFSFPVLADQARILSFQPAPIAITELELVNTVVAIAVIFFAIKVRRGTSQSGITASRTSEEKTA